MRRDAAAAGQRAAQPIVATKHGEFNRPEKAISLQDEDDQIIAELACCSAHKNDPIMKSVLKDADGLIDSSAFR
ncbi:hypothetical protein [Burkholderia catarinensis]|uniref:hypothetical protein n=1 Tax=Burkholderia catarinensis TaxID=1108140 RepID=UPI001FE3DCC8|nr:hypothetical protein [Burkholderia catarinensis]